LQCATSSSTFEQYVSVEVTVVMGRKLKMVGVAWFLA